MGLVIIYAGLGEKDQALDWLEQAYKEHSSILMSITIELSLDPLRSEPRFQALLKKMRLDQ